MRPPNPLPALQVQWELYLLQYPHPHKRSHRRPLCKIKLNPAQTPWELLLQQLCHRHKLRNLHRLLLQPLQALPRRCWLYRAYN